MGAGQRVPDAPGAAAAPACTILGVMPLSDAEVRVLGALIEKERTTPEAYPLSIGACVTACNQRTSRDPVTDLHLQEVQEALQRLRDRGLVATVQGVADRVPKHRHRLAEALPADARELALLSVLMLRGAQTPGELRSRTERYVAFPTSPTSPRAAAMAARPAPLVRDLGRAPGQSQDRWTHTLGHDETRLQPRVRGTGAAAAGARSDDEAGADQGCHGRPASGRGRRRVSARPTGLEAASGRPRGARGRARATAPRGGDQGAS